MNNWYSLICYEEGRFFLNNIGCNIMPMNTAVLLRRCFAENNQNTPKIVYAAAKFQAKLIIDELKQKNPYDICDLLKSCMQFIGDMGLGRLEIVSTNKAQMSFMVKNENSPFARQHLKIFGTDNNAVDDFTCGLLAGFFQEAYGANFYAKEIACVAQGKNYCMFEVGKSSLKNRYELDIKEITSKEYTHLRPESRKISSEVLERTIGNKLIQCNDGMCTVWGFPAFLWPIESLVLLQELQIREIGETAGMVLFTVGYAQSKTAVDIQNKMFGYKRDIVLLKMVLTQAELIGIGKLRLDRFAEKDLSMDVCSINNPFTEVYGKLILAGKKTGKNKKEKLANSASAVAVVDYYVRGLCCGNGAGIFGCEMTGKEKKSIQSTEKESTIIIKNGKLNIPEKFKQILDIYTVRSTL
jgi:predicted hydrocarbon binding protein